MISELPQGWLKQRIGEIAEVVGGGTPSTRDPSNFGGNIPWITPKDLSKHHERRIFQGERNLTKKGLTSSSVKLLPKDSVILSSRAPIGYVAIAGTPLATNQGCRNFVLKDNCSPEYIYYVLKTMTKILKSHASGTTFDEISGSSLKHIGVVLPPLPEQKKIASILSTLDDKIELNHQMNRTLEEMAQAIFKSWFVDFEPFQNGEFEYNNELQKEIPKGWSVGTVADLCKRITNGGTPRRMESRFWNGGTFSWFKTGELTDGVLLDSEEKITHEGLKNSSCHLLPINTVIVALYASPTVGRLGLLKVPATTNQACSALETKDEIGYAYVFHVLLSNREHLNNIAVGSAQQNISQAIIKNLKTIIPPTSIVKKFHRLVEPLYDQMTNNEIESYKLAKIRDVLLPKLLSGEIRVNAKEDAEVST